jgi:hypothetical protein
VSELDPREILRQARQLVKSEQYAEALEKYIWFHDHALDTDRALVVVRLSYAISEWVDLGEVYPPARSALESVRDAKAELLAQGTYDVNLFHDVASAARFPKSLGQRRPTVDLSALGLHRTWCVETTEKTTNLAGHPAKSPHHFATWAKKPTADGSKVRT